MKSVFRGFSVLFQIGLFGLKFRDLSGDGGLFVEFAAVGSKSGCILIGFVEPFEETVSCRTKRFTDLLFG